MELPEKDTFHYTYSAKQQEEIKAIRKKYAAPEEDKIEQLRRLDASVTNKASVRAMTVGVLGTLLMGFGMSLSISELAEIFGGYRDLAMVIGIMVGLIGMVTLCFGYPIYRRTVQQERKRVAPEILRLTNELMK